MVGQKLKPSASAARRGRGGRRTSRRSLHRFHAASSSGWPPRLCAPPGWIPVERDVTAQMLCHIALRGGAPSPAAPLESVDDLAGDPDVRCALEWLEKAEVLATDAHDRVEAARGRLGAAALLRVLNDEGGGDEDARDAAPWEQSPCLSERLNGVMELSLALSKAADLVEATAAASKAAFGSSGSTD